VQRLVTLRPQPAVAREPGQAQQPDIRKPDGIATGSDAEDAAELPGPRPVGPNTSSSLQSRFNARTRCSCGCATQTTSSGRLKWSSAP
jgi:hypothetical protein